MQAKSRVRITAKSGQVYEATAKVAHDGRVTVGGKVLVLDTGKVDTVQLEQRASNGRITSTTCVIAGNGTVKINSGKAAPSTDLAQLAPVPSTTARQAAIPAYGASGKGKSSKVGPYDGRDAATLVRNVEREGWELRLRKGDQLTSEQLTQLRAGGWRWYGGRLQAFCLHEKHATRDSLTTAQEIVTGFNSGAFKAASDLAAFAEGVANGALQGSSFTIS